MHFSVTQNLIDVARRNHRTKCPLALAIKKEFLKSSVEVGATYAIIDGKEIQLDIKAIKAIERFDKTGKMQPFSFDCVG